VFLHVLLPLRAEIISTLQIAPEIGLRLTSGSRVK
jgi:hypothetical protein